MSRISCYSVFLAATVAAWTVSFAPSAWAVDFANVTVTDDAGNPQTGVPTVSIAAGQSTVANAGLGTEGFFVDPGAVAGEFPIRIGASAANDADNGVLLGYVSQNGRQYLDLTAAPETLFPTGSTVRDDSATATNTRGGTGGLSLVADRSGNSGANSSIASGNPINANFGAAYFPFSQGWVGGTALNATDGGAIDQFIGSAGLALGTNVVPNALSLGDHRIVIPGVTDTRRQGLLFTMHAKNEDNFTGVAPTADGSGYNLTTKDNASDASSAMVDNDELDPFSFVFLPLGTPNITMASIHGGSGPNAAPTAMIQSGGNFTVSHESLGTYRLHIDGQTSTSGVLLVQGTGSYIGSGGVPQDNVVTYQADGDDWLIQSRDLPNLGLQDSLQDQRQSYFSFAFLPLGAPPTAPGPVSELNFTKSDVLAWNSQVTEVNAAVNENSTTPGMYVDVTGGTPGIKFYAPRQNKGDNGFSADGAFLGAADGVMMVQVSEGLRDNSATGGSFDYGIAAAGYVGGTAQLWEVATHIAGPGVAAASSVEHNVSFAAALFGPEAGFTMAAGVPITAAGHMDLALPGVNTLTDGVLMANAHGNVDNWATVTPKTDGSGWGIDTFDNNTSRENTSVNYVYLPYDTQNLVAGQVAKDGSLLSSTDPGDFTLVKQSTGTYLLTINGRTPNDGMLLLNGAEDSTVFDNNLVYEAAGNSFRILGVDLITFDEQSLGGLFTSLEDTNFSFAFIDYLTPPTPPVSGLAGDYNDDNIVDAADYSVWRDHLGSSFDLNGNGNESGASAGLVDLDDYAYWKTNFGNSAGSGGSASRAGAVPEPSSLWIAVAGLLGMIGTGWRKKES